MHRLIVDLGAAYYDRVTARLPDWRADCAWLAQHLGERARLVVDLGTGPGVSAYEIASANPRVTVLGVDFSHLMLRRAFRNRLRYPVAARRVELARADATVLPVASDSVDAVTTHSFLYLARDRRAVLAEVRRVLRPGGVIVAVEPRHERPALPPLRTWRTRFVYAWTMFVWGLVGRFEGAFRDGELASLLRESGLTVRVDGPSLEGYGCFVIGSAPPNTSRTVTGKERNECGGS